MPTLDWIGKDKVINHHLDVPYRVLERKYSFDAGGQHEADNGSENMIIHGDNLDALKSLLPRYEGKVKCIYIDPPYNTGNEGWVYNDMVMTTHGHLVMVEYKGDNLDNSNNRKKLSIGKKWEAKAGSQYKYFMVFKEKEFGLDGAYTQDNFIDVMKEL